MYIAPQSINGKKHNIRPCKNKLYNSFKDHKALNKYSIIDIALSITSINRMCNSDICTYYTYS